MLFKNGTVLTGDFSLRKVDVRIGGGVITEIGSGLPENGDIVKDIEGKYLLPGLIDEHLHGANGASVRDLSVESLMTMAKFEATNGVTTFVPTLSSYPEEVALECIKAVKAAMKQSGGATVAGLHLEGPFLCEKYRGAHDAEYLQTPSTELLSRYIKAADGIIKLMTIAPELPNAKEVVRLAVQNGITVGIGHSDATAREAAEAIDAGATVSIHTFNAMRPLHHRKTGILDTVLTDDRVHCEVIGDFGHVSPNIVKLVFACKGADKVNFVSDSISAAGLPDGVYDAEEHLCTVKDGISYFEDGTINGSASTVLRGVKNAVSVGIPLEAAVKAASLNPAVSLGTDSFTGSIAVGKDADLFVADGDINPIATYVKGCCVFGE